MRADSFTLSATVSNAGDGASAATTLRYYQSTDATISSADTEVGTYAVGELAAGGTSPGGIPEDNWQLLDAPSPAGTYYYGACVDAVTGESDTTNNCSGSVAVTVNNHDTGAPTISVAGQNSSSARAYITAEIGSGDDTVSWYDPDGCTSEYNLYLIVTAGSGAGTTTRTHLRSAASGSTQATLPITHSISNPFDYPSVELQLYCGEYDSSSPRTGRLASTSLSMRNSSNLRHGTFSSAPLTALSVSSATLSPSFNRGIYRYTTSVPSDSRTITIVPTGLTGYQFEYVKNPGWGTMMGCGSTCVYAFGGTKLTDSDVYTSGFQVELDPGENRLAVALHKGEEGAGAASLHLLTVTVANVEATGEPTIGGTTKVGQTLTASTTGISDEDGLGRCVLLVPVDSCGQ